MDYDEHFKVTVRKEIAEERAKANKERYAEAKFIEAEKVNVSTGDPYQDAKLLDLSQEFEKGQGVQIDKLVQYLEFFKAPPNSGERPVWSSLSRELDFQRDASGD